MRVNMLETSENINLRLEKCKSNPQEGPFSKNLVPMTNCHARSVMLRQIISENKTILQEPTSIRYIFRFLKMKQDQGSKYPYQQRFQPHERTM